MLPIYIRRGCLCFALLFSTDLAQGPAPPQSPPAWFWGCWVVSKWLPVRDISALSPEQVKTIIGRRLVFTPTCARTAREVLKSPVYSIKVESDENFFSHGSYAHLREIGVQGKEVTKVEFGFPSGVPGREFPLDEVYLRKKDVIICVETDYFVARKAKPGDPACGCEGPRPE